MNDQLKFEFLPTPQLYFGVNQISLIGTITNLYGTKALIVASESVFKNEKNQSILKEKLSECGIRYQTIFIKGEPEIEQIDKAVELSVTHNSEVVIGIGGGSVIDAGKAIAGISTNGGSAQDYMEVIGKGKKILKEPLPFIAIPTTAGTGSEATKNAVIFSKKHRLKTSIRSPLLLPKVAIIDPELMITLPPDITASTGLDALTQLIEAYTSNKAQPITDVLALMGIEKITESILRVYEEGTDLQARSDMALGAYLSGVCLANSGLGAVHGFAGPIGGLLNIPHGVVCGALLAPTIEENIRTMISKVPYHPLLEKYVTLGNLLAEFPFETTKESIQNLIGYLKNLSSILKIPKLSKYGLKSELFNTIIKSAMNSSSMKYNPVKLNESQLVSILDKTM